MKVLRIILSLFLIFALIATPLGLFKYKPIITKSEENKCVLSIWQIDCFEGGVGSRKQFLFNIAKNFEKQNNGVYVMVQNKTVFDAENCINRGEYPDMISYANGITVKNLKQLYCEKDFSGGKLNNKFFAVPWCRGGYVLILNPLLENDFTSKIDNLIVSQNDYTLPLTAMFLEGYEINEYEILQPLDAYIKFIENKIPYFLGTQRDLVRLNNRNIDVKVKPLYKFNNLYQYISITTENEIKQNYSQSFINYLLEEKQQKTLKNISMLSPFYSVDNEVNNINTLNDIQYLNTISAFTSKNNINLIKSITENCLKGNESDRIKLKNMLIST